jgi:proteic killer suppression protein
VVIIFLNEGLQLLCAAKREATRKLGKKNAKKLRTRLADLMAASRVTDLVAGHPHPLKGDRAGQFAVSLDGGFRLVFEPAANPAPLRDDGAVAWNAVTEVRIVFIGDYHD